MKMHLFNPDSGAYFGEDFADEAMERGAFVLPPDATAIAPPKVEFGQALICNASFKSKMISRRRGRRRRRRTLRTLRSLRRANEESALIWNWNNADIQQWEVHQRQCIDSPLPAKVNYEEMRGMNHEQV